MDLWEIITIFLAAIGIGLLIGSLLSFLIMRANRPKRKTTGPGNWWLADSAPWLRVSLIVVLVLLLVSSLVGVRRAYSASEIIEDKVPVMSYNHTGKFDYLVYVYPSSLTGTSSIANPTDALVQRTSSLYFTRIIDSIEVIFDYNFVPDQSVDQVATQVDFVATVTGPNKWQKTIPITNVAGGSRVAATFPLELDKYGDLVNTIERELGYVQRDTDIQNSYDILIEAIVKVRANTGFETINDTLVQPMKIKVGYSTLTWDDQPYFSQRGYVNGFGYKQQGGFAYTIKLKPNSLYSGESISSRIYRPPTLVTQLPGEVILPRLTDVMKANYFYQFRCDKPVSNLKEELSVTATIEYPGVWSRTFTLVPNTQGEGDLGAGFSFDVNYFAQLISAIKSETGLAPPTHKVKIVAVVHTSADSDFGRVDEIFTQTLGGELSDSAVIWDRSLETSKTGAITRDQVVANPDKLVGLSIPQGRILFPSLSGVIFVAFLLAG
ncbi:MAG: hypothetical protein PHU08_02220, partial [Dehalococcoidales bacterium]|nr:hypothetical protein [Dehalococcoidales bacterium]